MAVSKKEVNKLLMSGAIAGAATPFILKYAIMPILNMIGQLTPTISLKLANPDNGILINIRQSLTGIQSGLATWLTNALGITLPENIAITIMMAAIGGALLFLAGGYVADMLNLLKGSKEEKTRNTIFIGNIIAGFILGGAIATAGIGLTLVNILIAFLINAIVLSMLFSWVDSQLKLGLIPY